MAESGQEKAVKAGDIVCALEKIEGDIFFLCLAAQVEGETEERENRYLFTKTELSSLCDLPKTELCMKMTAIKDGRQELTAENTGEYVLVGLMLQAEETESAEDFIFFSDNYFYLLPKEQKRILVTSMQGKTEKFHADAFNLTERKD